MSLFKHFDKPGRRLGSGIVTQEPPTPPLSERPSMESAAPAAPRFRRGTKVRAGKINMKGEILGGVVPIGSVLEVGGSLIVGNVQPGPPAAPPAQKANATPRGGNAVANPASSARGGDGAVDDEDLDDDVGFEELNYEARGVGIFMPVSTKATLNGDMRVGPLR